MSILNKEKLLIGIALKPHGIKGEVKVFSLVDNIDIFKTIDNVWYDSKKLKISNVRIFNDYVYLTFLDINTRNDAESIRGELYVDRTNLPKLGKDRHYIVDLIGLDVYIDDEKVGNISDIFNCKANDVIVVSGKENFMFPFLNKVIISLDDKKIVLSKSILQEIAVYNK
ncbi:MAG TPA: 16S rRNA processing protein RimM [Clostridiales bacterium]|nr:16S rRNA processing protein RimM [Clostridiales bacterium]